MVLLRPSPNEEARILKEEREKRRKLRLQQVREQSKELAAKTRESVKAVKENEYHKLAQNLEKELNEKKAERERFLQELYLNSVRVLGEAHNNASKRSEELKIENMRAKQKVTENHKKAIQRHHEAMSHQQFEQALKFQQENRHIFAKEKALAIERERAALVASLPPPEDPLAPSSSFCSDASNEVMRTIPVIDYNGQVGTYFQQTTCFAQKEVICDQENAKEAAVKEDEKQALEIKSQMALMHEQNEKARLRGIAALNQVHLENEYESMCSKLEEMKQQDLQRRQQNVAKISKNIFLPPHRREEEKIQQQNAMENAFEKIYSSKPGANTDELQLSAGVGEEKEDETGSEEVSLQMSDSLANPLFGMVRRHGKDKASASDLDNNTAISQDVQPPLKKLLAKINDQREQISRQNVKVIEQYEPLIAVDDTSNEQPNFPNNSGAQESASRSQEEPWNSQDTEKKNASGFDRNLCNGRVEEKGTSTSEKNQTMESVEDEILPAPYEPEMLAAAMDKLKSKELDISVAEVPCRDTDVDVTVDKYGKNSFSEMEPIITSGPNFKHVPKINTGIQVDGFDYTGMSTTNIDETLGGRERETSPVSRYLEAANKRELSTSSIEENLKKIREKNQKLLEKYNKAKERRTLGIISDRSDGTSNTELSAPTRDVGLNRSKEKADLESSVNNEIPSTSSKKVDNVFAERSRELPLFVSPESQGLQTSTSLSDVYNGNRPMVDSLNYCKPNESKFQSSSGTLFQTNVPRLFNQDEFNNDRYQLSLPSNVTPLENFRHFSGGDSDAESSMTDVTLSDIPTPTPSLTSSDFRKNHVANIQIDTSLVDKYRYFGPEDLDPDFERLDQAWSLPSTSKKETTSSSSPVFSHFSTSFKQQRNIFRDVTLPAKEFGNDKGSGDHDFGMYGIEPLESHTYDTRSHEDETVRWLLEKYRNLDIKYDTSSVSEKSFSLSKESLEFTVNNEDTDQYHQSLVPLDQNPPLLSVFEQGNTNQRLAYKFFPSHRDIMSPLREERISLHSLDSTKISDFEKVSVTSDPSLFRTAVFHRAQTSSAGEQSSVPEIIEIQGEARRTLPSPSQLQDITIVTPLQTPLNQDNFPVDTSAVNLESTQPFTPENNSQSPEKLQSTPYSNTDGQAIASVSLNSSMNSLSDGSKASFTVVDGNEVQTINISQSGTDSGYVLVSDAIVRPLKEEKCLSPYENSSEGSCSNVITPETGISSAKDSSASGSAGSNPKSGSMVSITPEVDPETTLTDNEKFTPQMDPGMNNSTPLVTSAKIDGNVDLMQHFDPLPTIESGDAGANETINSERSLGDRVDDQLAMLDRLLNRSDPAYYVTSASIKPKSPTGSVDTLEPKSGAVLVTLPHSRSEGKLEELSNKTSPGTSVSPESIGSSAASTLVVVNKGGVNAKLESIKPFVSHKSNESLEQQEIESNKETDTTQSSLGLIDLAAVNTSLNDSLSIIRPVAELRQYKFEDQSKKVELTSNEESTSDALNLSARNWAEELSQFKIAEGCQSTIKMGGSSLTRKKSSSVTSSTSSGSRKSINQHADKSLHVETGGGDVMKMNVGGGSNSSSGKSQSIEVEYARDTEGDSDKLNAVAAAQRALEALKDFDISGISVLKEHDISLKSGGGESSSSGKYSISIENRSLIALNESLMSFRRHEEELLRTDITQDDLVLSVNSSILRKSAELDSVKASKEFPKCDATLVNEDLQSVIPGFSGALRGAAVSGEEFDNGTQEKPSLQELFNSRMQKFIEASKQRQEKVHNVAVVTPKEVIKRRWDKQSKSKTSLYQSEIGAVKTQVKSSKSISPTQSSTKTKAERKVEDLEKKERTKKLYSQLEEVKRAEASKKKRELAVMNRSKAQEYSKKVSRKNQTNNTPIVVEVKGVSKISDTSK